MGIKQSGEGEAALIAQDRSTYAKSNTNSSILERMAAASTLTSILTERVDRMGLYPSGSDAPRTRKGLRTGRLIERYDRRSEPLSARDPQLQAGLRGPASTPGGPTPLSGRSLRLSETDRHGVSGVSNAGAAALKLRSSPGPAVVSCHTPRRGASGSFSPDHPRIRAAEAHSFPSYGPETWVTA